MTARSGSMAGSNRAFPNEEATADLDVVLNSLASLSPQNYPQQEPVAELETYADSIVRKLSSNLVSIAGRRRCAPADCLRQCRQPASRTSCSRDREIAIRSVLGATHGGLVRQLLIESMVLASPELWARWDCQSSEAECRGVRYSSGYASAGVDDTPQSACIFVDLGGFCGVLSFLWPGSRTPHRQVRWE